MLTQWIQTFTGTDFDSEVECLREKFRSCPSTQVIEIEFREQLSSTKWFKTTPPHFADEKLASSYITCDQAFIALAQLLQWDEEKRKKYAKKGLVRDLCLRCASARVATDEFVQALVQSRLFGVAPNNTPSLARKESPSFLSLQFFADPPAFVHWSEILLLYQQFRQYVTRFQDVDDLFSALQLNEYKKLNKKDRAKNDMLREAQLSILDVPFHIFVREFMKTVCPLNLQHVEVSDPFWSTACGKQWQQWIDKPQSNEQRTISWAEVRDGFKSAEPCVPLTREQQGPLIHDDDNAIVEQLESSSTPYSAVERAQQFSPTHAFAKVYDMERIN